MSVLVRRSTLTFCLQSKQLSRCSSTLQNIFHVEAENGITELIGHSQKVIGTIKESPADFQIHEIDINGKKIQLTDAIPPDVDDLNCEDGKTVNFTLYKDGISHLEAFDNILKQLKTKPEKVRFISRKEKWAQTTQRMSILNCHHSPSTLLQLSADWTKMKLGNFDLTDPHQKLGNYRGNHFNILLRNLQPHHNNKNHPNTSHVIHEGMKNLNEIGFINYFPLDRMGVEDYRIGRSILQKNWTQAFDLMLTPYPNDEEYIKEVKSVWWSERDPEKMLTLIAPRDDHLKFDHEGHRLTRICNALSLHYTGQQDFERLYRKLSQEFRRGHVKAFMNYHWNHMASFRIKTFGMQVVPGDFVLVSNPFSELMSTNSRVKRYHKKLVTQEEIVNNKCSIKDVLLPYLGVKVHGYHNPTVQKYNSIFLRKHGLPADLFISLNNIIFEAERGYYRPLIVKPQILDYKIISYDDQDDLNELMPSDLDCLGVNKEEKTFGQFDNNLFGGDDRPKNKMGCIVQFSLPIESHVTSLLREFMQISNFDFLMKNKYF